MEPVEATEALLADMPLPSDAKTFFLGGIFVLASLSAAYVASEIVLPLIFAVMLNLLMQPALSALERLRVPRALGSILLILVVLATIVGIGAAVSGPAEAWIAKLPEGIPRIEAAAALSRRADPYASDVSDGGEQFRRRRSPRETRPGLLTAARFCRASSPGREASPAGCSRP